MDASKARWQLFKQYFFLTLIEFSILLKTWPRKDTACLDRVPTQNGVIHVLLLSRHAKIGMIVKFAEHLV